MDEQRAQRVVDQLREHGVDARIEKAGVYEFGVRVRIAGGREAIWDSDGAAGLEAQVMLDGMLVGFVPVIPGSEDYDEPQIVAAIATTDYDAPMDSRSSAPEDRRPRRRHWSRSLIRCRAMAECSVDSSAASARSEPTGG